MARFRILISALVAALCVVAAAAATAGDDYQKRSVVIVGEDGEKATLTFDGSRLTVTAQDGDDISVHEVDLAEIAGLLDEAIEGAMAGVQAAFDALAAQNIEVKIEPEHRVVVNADGTTTTVDLDAVMAAVAGAMENLATDIETADEISGDEISGDEAQLQQEIEELREEIARLRSELDQTAPARR